MQSRRKPAVLLAAFIIAAAGAPAADAQAPPVTFPGAPGTPAAGNVAVSGCGSVEAAQGQGGTGGSEADGCTGTGAVSIGSSSTVNTLIGPTITSPGSAGVVIVANGPVAYGP